MLVKKSVTSRPAIFVAITTLWLSGVSARASIEFDNGAPVAQDLGLRYNHSNYTVFDDFILASDTTVSGFRWSQFEEAGLSYANSTVLIFDGIPTPSNLVHSLTLSASRNSNGLMLSTDKVPSGQVQGFDYSILGQSIPLTAGTYWLGIRNDVSGGATLMANSNGGTDSVSGFYQLVGDSSPPLFGLSESGPSEFNNGYVAFQVLSSTPPDGVVPEPASLVVWSLLGVVGAGVAWRRSRRASIA